MSGKKAGGKAAGSSRCKGPTDHLGRPTKLSPSKAKPVPAPLIEKHGDVAEPEQPCWLRAIACVPFLLMSFLDFFTVSFDQVRVHALVLRSVFIAALLTMHANRTGHYALGDLAGHTIVHHI